MTPVGSLNRKDELTKLPDSQRTTPRGTDTARRNSIARYARYYPPATLPSVSFSQFSPIASLSSTSSPYSISPWINLQGHYFSPQRSLRAASDSVPTRSSSLRGLRAIFKRTSAGLTGGQRQRAESLKELISEPRVLSLGSVSITNLRDAGIAGGCGQEESTATTGELAQKATVKS
jgi:ABC-type glutathione transport system ATPase component